MALLLMAAILFFPVHDREHKEFWSLSLIGSTFDSVSGTCCITVHTKFHGILATVCPRDVFHEVQQAELCATCSRDKISPKLVGRVPTTFSCVCKCCDFVPATCPRHTSLQHVASVCTTHVFVAATCRCNFSLQHVPAT